MFLGAVQQGENHMGILWLSLNGVLMATCNCPVWKIVQSTDGDCCRFVREALNGFWNEARA